MRQNLKRFCRSLFFNRILRSCSGYVRTLCGGSRRILGNGGNMSAIAKKLNITMGSLTTAMNSLVNKKYVERHRSEEDRRVVFVRLTAKGVRAYRHHEDYHRQMTQAILDKLDEKELPVLLKTLDALDEFFTGYSRKEFAQKKDA